MSITNQQSNASLVVREIRQIIAQLPVDEGSWLTPAETQELATWRAADRRQAWLASRWTAKQLILERTSATGEPIVCLDVEVLSRDSSGKGVRPIVSQNGQPWPGTLSISHCGPLVCVFIHTTPNLRVGCDLQSQDRLPPGFEQLWFTDREQQHLSGSQYIDAWAAKEAFYKAGNCGEPFQPRRWQVLPRGKHYACEHVETKRTATCKMQRTSNAEIAYVLATCTLDTAPHRAIPSDLQTNETFVRR